MTSTPIRVLLVEDCLDDAELVHRALVKAGFEPALERVETAVELERWLDTESWDVVVCDHVLPQFSSSAAHDLVKSRGLDIPFIIVSGRIGEEAAVEAMQAGAHDYVMKDRLGRLGPAVARSLGHVALRRKQQAQEAELARIQQLDALGALAAGMAHDINNILTIVLANAQLAGEALTRGLPVSEHLAQISAASELARDVVKKILAFGRQPDDQRVAVNPAHLVQEVLPMLRAGTPAGVEFDAVIGSGVPEVLADETLLRQVLINLVTNAWQAMEIRKGRVTLAVEAVVLDAGAVSSLPAGRYVRISVTDTGTGMDAPTAARVFEPFFTTKNRAAGTGLGLAVVHGIVRQHGGVITVDTDPGRGTTFTIHLPEHHEADGNMPHGGAGRHVLYVEDDALVAMGTSAVLRRLGYVVTATSGPCEALAALRDAPHTFDVVLLELQLTEMNGLQLAREIASIRGDLPIVVTSETRVTPIQMAAARIAYHLEKPYSDRSLARSVAAALASVAG
jgi:signal transduction histidine kinase